MCLLHKIGFWQYIERDTKQLRNFVMKILPCLFIVFLILPLSLFADEVDSNSSSTPSFSADTATIPEPDEVQVSIGLWNAYFFWFDIIPSGVVGSLRISNIQIFEGSKAWIRFTLGGGIYREFYYRDAEGNNFGTPENYNPDLQYSGSRANIEYSVIFTNDFPYNNEFFISPFIYFRGESGYRLREEPFQTPIWYNSDEWFFRHDFIGGVEVHNLYITDDAFFLRRGISQELSMSYAIGSSPRITARTR